ncbi:MAG TPA: hypothetical protein PKA00_02510 [Saprospiraceae bacterium]|nr:hypothetical protein [Saprospiraceae bacterium]HMQ81745.1 hypothetical protein [Saprospiraceae bacterium]
MFQPAFAVERHSHFSPLIAAIQPTTSDSAAVLTPEPMKKSWLQKTLERKMEKKLEKAVEHGQEGKKKSKYGLISMLLIIGAAVPFFLPYMSLGVLPILVFSLIFGIKGIKLDEDKVMAYIGTIVSGLIIGLSIIAGFYLIAKAIAFLIRVLDN